MKVTGLTLGYTERVIVDAVDLDLPSGELTAIVGPNGSGKSTLLRGMSRLLRPRAGSVHLDGVDIAALSGTQLARRLALLPQSPLTPESLTVGDLVSRGRFPHRSWFQRWSPADDAAVREALEQVSLLDRFADPVSELSGGQRQRAWLAMVLAQDTPYLLLDEPTTFLDLAHAVDVMALARRIAHESERTVVCVIHDLTLAARFADHVVVLSEGEVAAAGAPTAVLSEQLLSDVFGLTARVLYVDGAPAIVPTRHL
jgi:iron complex transport system ATP-binding protein